MKNTKKLVGAVAALAVASALATGTTYAWFTSNGTARINTFSAKVTAQGNDLEIAVVPWNDSTTAADNMSWGYYVSTAQVVQAIVGSDKATSIYGDDNGYSEIALDALTTANSFSTDNGTVGTTTNKKPRTYSGTAATTGDITLYENNGQMDATDKATTYKSSTDKASGKYLIFDLVFRTKNSGLEIDLSSESEVTANGDAPAGVYAKEAADASQYGQDSAITKGESITARAADAVRVAFTDGNNGSSGTTAPSTATSIANTFWCPNEYFVTGAQYDGTTDDNATKGANPSGYFKNNLASDWCEQSGYADGYVASTVATPSGLTLLDSTKTEGTAASEIIKFGSETETISENTYYTARTTVVIWLEGTDGDCFNAIYEDVLDISLVFKAVVAPSASGSGSTGS